MKLLLKTWFFSYLFYLSVFVLFKTTFILIYATEGMTLSEILPAYYHGFIMDLSAASWLMLLPSLLISLAPLFGLRYLRIGLTIYNALILFALTLLLISDLELYQHWGFRIDATIFNYLDHPGGAIASVSTGHLIFLILAILCVSLGLLWTYKKLVINFIADKLVKKNYLAIPLFLFLTAGLLLPIRGGLQITPLNPGNVYFSEKPVLNHAATNVFWNFNFSLDNFSSTSNPYVFFEADKEPFRKASDDSFSLSIFKNKRPNIVLIVTESFTSKAIGYSNVYKNITPYTDSLISHGILFDQFYASGDRTDKGLVSILSGYPSQPTDAVVKYPQKTQNLPQLSTELKKSSYYTSFFYGGDVNFASMYSFLSQGGYNEISDIESFSSADRNSKWGVHDHVVFKKVANDLDKYPEPFFSVCLTLSNHEPFDTPAEYGENTGKTDDEKFLNTCKYTDWSIGNFIESCRSKKWFANTVFIIVADHGHSLPGNDAWYSLPKYKIPLILYGDVLNVRDTIIHTISSQTDLAATLLSQMGLHSDPFIFSENILSDKHPSAAFYTFNNGFAYINPNGHVIYDQVSKALLESEGNQSSALDSLGKKYMQKSYSHFLELQFGL